MKSDLKEIRRLVLHCDRGTSDKLYILELFVDLYEGEFLLKASWGRRGNKMTYQDKIKTGLTYAVDEMYMDLKDSKLKKGYHVVKEHGDTARYWWYHNTQETGEPGTEIGNKFLKVHKEKEEKKTEPKKKSKIERRDAFWA